MKTFLSITSKLCFLVLFQFAFLQGNSQSLHIDYKQTVGTPNHFEVEVWVSNTTAKKCDLSALNNVFGFMEGLEGNTTVVFNLSEKYKTLMPPINSLLADKKIIRATQVPVQNSSRAISVSEKPELFGTLVVKTSTTIKYPLTLKPAIQGNPTVQSIVYFENSINSTALTLKSMSITTDENPLVLKLLGQQVAIAEDEIKFYVYPNPTTHLVYFDVVSETLANYQIELFDQAGKFLYRTTPSDVNTGFIDMSGYTAGTYLLAVKNGHDQVKWQKVIKID